MAKESILNRFVLVITAAFAFVVSLAWNDVILSLFKGPCGAPDAGALCMVSEWGIWVYAIVLTIIAVVITYFLFKLVDKEDDKDGDKHCCCCWSPHCD